MLIDLKNIVGFPGYFIDDQTYEIWSFKRYKDGRKIKLQFDNTNGYSVFGVYNEGKHKNIRYHQVIVKVFIDPTYDPSTQQIDHLDHNKLNNSIDNLRVVSAAQNQFNKTAYGGKQAIYLDNIGDSIAVNTEHGVYYSKTLDKFYRFVEHIGKYRQMTESKNRAHMLIGYKYNKKPYNINTTKFREALKMV